MSEDLEVIETFNELCRPTYNPILSDYFVKLTHITNEQIEKDGILFSDAYEKFGKFVVGDVGFSHSWGGDYNHKSDGTIIDENLDLYGIKNNYNIVFRNIAAVFMALYKKNNLEVSSNSSW